MEVSRPGCELSTKLQLETVPVPSPIVYTHECEFTFEIGGKDYLNRFELAPYMTFTIIVRNECYAANLIGWQSKTLTVGELYSNFPTHLVYKIGESGSLKFYVPLP